MRALAAIVCVVSIGCSPRPHCLESCDGGGPPVCEPGTRIACAPCAERVCLPSGFWDYCREICDAGDDAGP